MFFMGGEGGGGPRCLFWLLDFLLCDLHTLALVEIWVEDTRPPFLGSSQFIRFGGLWRVHSALYGM